MHNVSRGNVLSHLLLEEGRKNGRKIGREEIDNRIDEYVNKLSVDSDLAKVYVAGEIRRHGKIGGEDVVSMDRVDTVAFYIYQCRTWEESDFEINEGSIEKIITWGDTGWRDLSENGLMLNVSKNVLSEKFKGHELHEAISSLNGSDEWIESFKPIIFQFRKEGTYLFADGGHRMGSLICRFLKSKKPLKVKCFVGYFEGLH